MGRRPLEHRFDDRDLVAERLARPGAGREDDRFALADPIQCGGLMRPQVIHPEPIGADPVRPVDPACRSRRGEPESWQCGQRHSAG